MSLKFHVVDQSRVSDAGIAIHILDTEKDHVVTNFVTEKYEKGTVIPSTPLQITKKEAQELMTQLWNLRVRPAPECF